MPFTLTLKNLAQRHSEFAFDSNEARLGRTADNDIVVKDSNASRSHCRVYVREGRYYLEDLQSANGTTLNGTLLRGEWGELRSGDTIGIGDVSFTFTTQTSPSTEIPSDFGTSDTVIRGSAEAAKTGELDVNHTVLNPVFKPGGALSSTLEDPPSDPKPPAPTDTDETEAKTEGPRTSQELSAPAPAMTDEVPSPARANASTTDRLPRDEAPAEKVGATVEVPHALEKHHSPPPAAQPPESERARVRRGGDKRPEEDSETFEPTAAQKARIRRHANKTVGGRLFYGFGQLRLITRVLLLGLASIAVFGLGAGAVLMLAPPRVKPPPAEPTELVNQGDLVEASFGRGDGVTYERSDMKMLAFKAASPTRLVGVLHYQARDISKDEVAISLNGVELGFVPPDALNSAERELEVVLPAANVKRNELNQLAFDNIRNPPGKDDWRVWNLWLELLPLPDTSPEEALIAVRDDLDRARKQFDQRQIGPEALFKAWKGYRDAWLKLESLPGRPNELYITARTQQAETWRLLDHRCKLMQVDVQRALTAKVPDYDTARSVLKEMLRYFPTREHPCHGLVKARLAELEQ